MTNTIKQLVTLVPLTLILAGLLSYNFMSAQWAGPTANAPGNNTDAPINTGTDPQDKNGVLGVNALAVFGSSTFSGQPNIQNTGPRLKFTDTDNTDFWTHANTNSFYVMADRNDDGTWTGENPWPMQLFASTSPNGDYARFSNQVRADEYCNNDGTVCSSGVGGTWGAWSTSSVGSSWRRNNNSKGIMVFFQGNSDRIQAYVSPTGTNANQFTVGYDDRATGGYTTGSFVVPPSHSYRFDTGATVSILVLPF